MFSEHFKTISLKNWSYGWIPEQIDRLSKQKLLVFHFLIVLWHFLLSFQTTVGALYILIYNKEIVDKTCGYGIQYITIWNHVIEQYYFIGCLVQDVLEFTPTLKYPKLRHYLKVGLPFVLSSIVFPLSSLVALNFWTIYSYAPRIIDEDNVTETFFPSWVNHGLHTTIFFLTCLEKFLVYRPNPSRKSALLGILSVVYLYAATCTILYFVGGVWPYPFLLQLHRWQKIAYIHLNAVVGFFFIIIGELLNNIIWGKKMETENVEEENADKKKT